MYFRFIREFDDKSHSDEIKNVTSKRSIQHNITKFEDAVSIKQNELEVQDCRVKRELLGF